MADKQETIADIVREMRRKEWDASPLAVNSAYYVRIRVLDWSDRIESAAKREREAAEADALSVGGVVEAARHKPGNAAAMREVLVDSQSLLGCFSWGDYGPQVRGQMRDNRAALAAPPRNCDRFNCGDPAKDAADAYDEWLRHCDGSLMPPSCKVESAFRQWLFATVKPETM